MKLGVGERIGVWVIQQALGRGGMGTVYRCHHVETPRLQAAIKVLGEGLNRPSEAQTRFIREAEILGALDHPHIVRVRGLRMDVHPPFIEMDFVDGTPLDRVVKNGPVEPERALTWMIQLTSALAYLHGKGIRHRDVKPGNVLVTAEDRLVLVDFGLATDADLERITQEGLSFGTVSYAPPEWMDPDRLDAVQWDLYAVAVIFYELLTGSIAYPLSGKGPVRKQLLQVAMAKQKAPPLDPGDGMPEAIRHLIRRATSKDVEQRYQSATELLEALQAARGEVARPQGMRPLVLAAIGAGFLVLLLGGAVLGFVTAGTVATRPAPPVPARQLEVEVAPPQEGSVQVAGPAGARVRLAERDEVLGEDGVVVLEGMEPGSHELLWLFGEGCEACLEEGGECPAPCGHGSLPVEVAAGGSVEVQLPEVPRVPVRVEAPAIAKGRGVFKKKAWPLQMDLGGTILDLTEAGVGRGAVAPGTYTLFVDVGSCAPSERGCQPDACSPKCSSVKQRVVVPWSGKVDVTVDVPPPQK